MKLAKIRITDYQSVLDSTEFEIDDVTCLVGKNEAGKTALLKALYKLNPYNSKDGDYDVTMEYPRRSVTQYKSDIASNRRKPAIVARAIYTLDRDEVSNVQNVFGPHCFRESEPTLTYTKNYSNKRTYNLNVDERKALTYLIEDADIPETIIDEILQQNNAEEMANVIHESTQKSEVLAFLENTEQREAVEELHKLIRRIADEGVISVIFNDFLKGRIPIFLYFDEYYQLKGQENLNELESRISRDEIEPADNPLIGLIEEAGLDIRQLIELDDYENLTATIEAAAISLTDKVLPYWSQNQHIRMRFDVRDAKPNDPSGMTNGTNIWGRVEDTRHYVSTSLGTRSRGFVWFFSFVAWYSKLRKEDEDLILLLDEPGLFLHAKAQEDLLHFIEEELKPHHQLIYTTHSPFMIDPRRFDRVRIVQDLSIEPGAESLPTERQGAKVTTEVLDVRRDSLFPLQGALGYEIYQNLFIGPNSLVVEGVSDLLYIDTISGLLQERGGEGLNTEWTITPVGGSDKVPTFVALIGGQSNLNVAVLVDFQKKDRQSIENLYKEKLLRRQQVLTYADYVNKAEADVEDMFGPGFYLELFNGAFKSSIKVKDLPQGPPRIVTRIDQFLTNNPLPNGAGFNHYRPARYFNSNIVALEKKLTEPQLDRWKRVFDDLNALL